MTAGYLALRRALFGHAVRGGIQSWHAIETFFGVVQRHFASRHRGHTRAVGRVGKSRLFIVLARPGDRQPCGSARRLRRAILCFCVGWWAIGVAPSSSLATSLRDMSTWRRRPGHSCWRWSPTRVYPRASTPLAVASLIATAARRLSGSMSLGCTSYSRDWHALARSPNRQSSRVRQEARPRRREPCCWWVCRERAGSGACRSCSSRRTRPRISRRTCAS